MKFNINNYMNQQKYNELLNIIKEFPNKEIVFFCVGNYKIWYDSFAPILSSIIKQIPYNKCFVYGGLDNAITPENLFEYMDFVKEKHPSACVIVVDNCLTSDINERGSLVISKRACKVAAYVNDRLFGDISVLLKTYINDNAIEFLNMQNQIIKNLVLILNKLFKNLV